MVLMPGFQSTRLVTEGALEPFFFLYTDDSIQGNTETLFFVKYFSLKKASEFPFFSKGFSLPSAGIMHPCA